MYSGQFSYIRFETWRTTKAIKLYYPELSEEDSRDHREKWSFDSFQKKTLELANRRSKYSTIENEVESYKEDIRIERAEIDRLDAELESYIPNSTSFSQDLQTDPNQVHKQSET